MCCGSPSGLELVRQHLQIDLGGGERSAQLVVDLARDAGPLVLLHALQEMRQLGQLGGALQHRPRELRVALFRLRGFLAPAPRVLAQSDGAQQQSNRLSPTTR